MSTAEELNAQLETMEAWRVALADEIKSPEFDALSSSLREYMRLQHHWLASAIDALTRRIALLQG